MGLASEEEQVNPTRNAVAYSVETHDLHALNQLRTAVLATGGARAQRACTSSSRRRERTPDEGPPPSATPASPARRLQSAEFSAKVQPRRFKESHFSSRGPARARNWPPERPHLSRLHGWQSCGAPAAGDICRGPARQPSALWRRAETRIHTAAEWPSWPSRTRARCQNKYADSKGRQWASGKRTTANRKLLPHSAPFSA